MNNNKKYRPVNFPVAAFGIMQAGIAIQMIWGAAANAWSISWLSTYVAVIMTIELGMYNGVVEKGYHPIKALYPILPMCGCAVFFIMGFMYNGWAFSWIALVAAAVAIFVIVPIDISVSKKYNAGKGKEMTQ